VKSKREAFRDALRDACRDACRKGLILEPGLRTLDFGPRTSDLVLLLL